jgi:hypothetical protein
MSKLLQKNKWYILALFGVVFIVLGISLYINSPPLQPSHEGMVNGEETLEILSILNNNSSSKETKLKMIGIIIDGHKKSAEFDAAKKAVESILRKTVTDDAKLAEIENLKGAGLNPKEQAKYTDIINSPVATKNKINEIKRLYHIGGHRPRPAAAASTSLP